MKRAFGILTMTLYQMIYDPNSPSMLRPCIDVEIPYDTRWGMYPYASQGHLNLTIAPFNRQRMVSSLEEFITTCTPKGDDPNRFISTKSPTGLRVDFYPAGYVLVHFDEKTIVELSRLDVEWALKQMWHYTDREFPLLLAQWWKSDS